MTEVGLNLLTNWVGDHGRYLHRHTTKTEQIVESTMAEMKGSQELIMAKIGAEMKTNENQPEAEIKVDHEEIIPEMKAGHEGMKVTLQTCPGKMEANQEDMEVIEGLQEVHNEEAIVETVGALKGISVDQQPALRYQNPWKSRLRRMYVKPLKEGRSRRDDRLSQNVGME